MTGMLASVRNALEAELVLGAGADIIDLKEPDRGALGALDHRVVREIVALIDRRAPVSATIGDLPFEADVTVPAIRAMRDTGVDIVKVGVFGTLEASTLREIGKLARDNTRIVLVFFAERWSAEVPYAQLAEAGMEGLMIDTVVKNDGALPDKLGMDTLCEFVQMTRAAGMIAGLAGSLRTPDVPVLMTARPDYLGFRSALCRDGRRGAGLDPRRVRAVRDLINSQTEGISNRGGGIYGAVAQEDERRNLYPGRDRSPTEG